MELLVVVDMQKDFIDGSLGTQEAQAIVGPVKKMIQEFSGEVVYTMDTHGENYLSTQEGSNLPVIHCVKGTEGWELEDSIKTLVHNNRIFEKPGFGSMDLAEYVKIQYGRGKVGKVILVGLCTDICVISNAMLIKAATPELEVEVKSECCAGVTPASHRNALEAMKMCQIRVV